MKLAAIILAAGRGSRMKGLTEDRPKCLVELAGKPLLAWQTQALKSGGAGRLLVCRGYRKECIRGDFETAENEAWENTNMLSTLLCADAFARDFFKTGDKIVISYSDIVYNPDHVKKLAQNQAHLAIAYDEKWEDLWRLRFGDPLLDAETFRQEGGVLREIGAKPKSLSEIGGQYLGLLAFDQKGWDIVCQTCAELGEKTAKTDMTAFLRRLLDNGVEIGAVPVAGKWCETDSEADLRKYEQALAQGDWSHDWR